jgi:membrane fusion protein (multidrug efflux system)
LHPDKGRFVFIDRAVDVKTGTLRVRAEFPNPNKILRPGMFARIKVDLGIRPNSILVPERAVAELQGKNFVWVIDAGNKATQRSVKVSEATEGRLLILEGLKPGERFVVEGLQKMREGVQVQPKVAGTKLQGVAPQTQAPKPVKD